MRYPYEQFLRYLVSRGADVRRALERIGLPPVGELWTTRVNGEMTRSATPHVRRFLREPEGGRVPREALLAWATSNDVDLFWRDHPAIRAGEPDRALELAGRLFFSAATRGVLGMLLLAEVAHDEIGQILNERFRIRVDDATIGMYERAYWDQRKTTPAFWNELLPAFGPEERHLYGVGLGWPAPRLDELRHLLGLRNGDLDPEEVLKEALALAHNRMREAAVAPVPEHQNIFKWMQMAERMAVQVRKGKKPEQKEGEAVADPAKAFNLFSITVDRTAIPTLADLEGELPERK